MAEVPWLLLGVLLAVAAAFGTLVCGWACPFGFLQDLLGKLTRHKLALPGWLGYMRYLVLAGLVVLLPWWLGARGIAYEDQAVSICRLCPAGALEAAVPHSVGRVFSGEPWVMSPWKAGILIAFVGAAVLIHRPWCRLVCPLGGWLAIFNRWSLFHLRFHAPACVGCNQCRSRCPIGVKVDQKVNVTGCVRCLECTSCGAVEPAFALPGRGERATAEPEHCPGTRG